MMDSMRPGVSASYTINPASLDTSGRGIGFIALNTNASDELLQINSQLKLQEIRSSISEDIFNLVDAMMSITNVNVLISHMTEDSESAFVLALERLIDSEDLYMILPIGDQLKYTNVLKSALYDAAANKKEKIAIFTCPESTQPSTVAQNINSERILLAYPKVTKSELDVDFSSAILASIITRGGDSASNFNSEHVSGDYIIERTMSESEINSAISAGVCIFEKVGEFTELIRGVTTKTYDENLNPTVVYKNLSTIILIDAIVPMIRNSVEQRMQFLVNSKASIDSLASQIVILLSEFVDDGLLSDYDNPILQISTEDPTRLIINLSFTIAQGINQIAITCHISV